VAENDNFLWTMLRNGVAEGKYINFLVDWTVDGVISIPNSQK
jgi:hypothetical protein